MIAHKWEKTNSTPYNRAKGRMDRAVKNHEAVAYGKSKIYLVDNDYFLVHPDAKPDFDILEQDDVDLAEFIVIPHIKQLLALFNRNIDFMMDLTEKDIASVTALKQYAGVED
jgi:hypothetical protein